ncbi:MAG: YkgJ family cysteine cluster protein [Chthoniobacteraceae bacterium]
MNSEPAQAVAARLCADCGLCCNGALFDRVILQPADRPRALAALGLRIKKKTFFNQPCTALCGTRCTIYADRPERCRLFECRQYRDVAAGTVTADAASARIGEAKRQIATVEVLLDALGGDNRRKPISQRCATILAEPPDPDSAALRASLAVAMNQLQATLTAHFRLG